MSHPTRELAAFVSALAYEDLPERLRGTLRMCFLDTVGCGLYGSGTPSGRILAAHARSAGGGGEATLRGEVPGPKGSPRNPMTLGRSPRSSAGWRRRSWTRRPRRR
ncbi:MAG: MmgE/PrpD family protein [Nitrospinota bacterium]